MAVALCAAVLAAQDDLIKRIDPVRAYDGVVDFQKTTQVAKVFEFNYPAKELENAVQGYLESRGAKVRGVNRPAACNLADARYLSTAVSMARGGLTTTYCTVVP